MRFGVRQTCLWQAVAVIVLSLSEEEIDIPVLDAAVWEALTGTEVVSVKEQLSDVLTICILRCRALEALFLERLFPPPKVAHTTYAALLRTACRLLFAMKQDVSRLRTFGAQVCVAATSRL